MAKYGKDAAKEDLQRILKFKPAILHAANVHAIQPEIIAAIISRETRGNPNFFIGDGGHGCGPMQIDDRSFPEICKDYKAKKLDESSMIMRGAEILEAKCQELDVDPFDNDSLKEALAAYNCGAANVRRALSAGHDADHYTTGANYGADVLERADFFEFNGF